MLAGLAAGYRQDAADWCRGRSIPLRALLAGYLLWGGLHHIFDPAYSTFLFGGITLGIHELGHVIFAPFGQVLMAAGGSITQLAGPVATALVFHRQRDFFGVAVAFGWLSFSLFNLAVYVGDASAELLPLVGLGDDPQHDWAYLLGRSGMLRWDGTFAFLLRMLAILSWGSSLALSAWLFRQMARPQAAGQGARGDGRVR